jgi:WD40 repeat protein
MGDVFISHASGDAAPAVGVAEALRNAGHRTFLDTDARDGISPGAEWQRTLYRELRICDAVVLLNSEDAQASMWCHTELAIAAELGKRIYSLDLTRGLGPHPLLASVQGIRLEEDLRASVDRLVERLALDGYAESATHTWDRSRPPYPGLAAMDVADAGVFFGRDTEVRSLLAQVDGPLGQRDGHLVVVMGPSGAGKSSLVRAGLVARLAAPRSGWDVVEPFEPGVRPIDRLLRRLVALVPGQLTERECGERLRTSGLAALGEWLIDHTDGQARRLLVTLDQAEQLATVTQGHEAEEFLSTLATGLGSGSPVTVVMTVRSDRFDEIQRLPVVGSMIHEPFVIAPMSRSQLSAVIEGPASRAGLSFEPGLVGRFIEDAVRGGSGEAVEALPLLAFTLREMYDLAVSENRFTITEADYERVGRIEGAIVRRTEAAESALPPDSGPVLERLLPRFVTLSDERLPAGRPVARDHLSDVEESIVQELEDQRLLTGEGHNIYLAHEQLITAWPTLANAVAHRRDDMLLQARLERQAGDWDQGHGELLGRDAAGMAGHWLSERAEPETEGTVVGRYVHASQAAVRTRRNRALAVLSGVVVLALVASVIAVVAGVERSDAVSQSQIAQSNEMAAEASGLLSTNAPLGMLLSLEAYRRAPTLQAGDALIQSASVPLESTFAVGSVVEGIAYSPDGHTLAVGSYDNVVVLFDTSTGTRKATLSVGGAVESLAFSPDGRLVAVGDYSGAVTLWDAASGTRVGSLSEGSVVNGVAFSPDGRTLAVGGYSGTVRIFDAASRALLTSFDEGAPVSTLAYSPDGSSLAVGDYHDDVRLWATATDAPSATLAEGTPVKCLAFSPGGQTLAVGDESGDVGLWNVASGTRAGTLAEGAVVGSIAFSPDGRTLAVGDYDDDVRLWNVASSTPTTTLSEGALVDRVAFSPDGRTLAVGDSKGYVGLWSVARAASATLLQGNAVDAVAFSRDGRTLAVGDDNFDVGLWNAATGTRTATLADGSVVNSVAFSPDGRLLAVGDVEGVGLWDVGAGSRSAALPEGSVVNTVAFSPDGRTLAAGDNNGNVVLWDVASRSRTATLSVGSVVTTLAFAPGGLALAAGDANGDVTMWSVAGRSRTATFSEGAGVSALAFTPDGASFAAGDSSGNVSVWDTGGGTRTATLSEGAVVSSLAFGPNGQTLAVGDHNDVVGLWNAASGARFANLIESGPVNTLAFSPDGQTLAVGDQNGDVALSHENLSDPNLASFAKLICGEVRRNIGPAQWTAVVPDQSYEKTCAAYG